MQSRLVENPERKIPLGQLDEWIILKWILKSLDRRVDLIHLAQGKDQCRAPVKSVMSLRDALTAGNSFVI
jgi:hypothetical protein